MRWLDDIKTQFITAFTRDIVCHFADGDFYRNMSTGALVTDQPSGTEWMRFTAIPGGTFNSTIGSASSRLKEELFNVRVSIFVPRNKTFATLATIESDVDAALIFDQIITADPGCINMDTSQPKIGDGFYAGEGDVWNQIELTYQYTYRYV